MNDEDKNNTETNEPKKEDVDVSMEATPSGVAMLKLPPFWDNRPDLWFIRVEAQFRAKGITASNTKYDHLVSSLSAETMEIVADAVLKPPKENRYEHLKKLLIERSTDSEERRLDALLHKIELGDSKPSELYRKMESLATSNSLINSSLLRKLWLNKLPPHVQTCLITIENSQSQDELFVIADKLIDTSPSTSKISAVAEAEDLFIDAVRKLENRIKKLETQSRSRNRSRDGSRDNYHIRKSTPSRVGQKICWYHRKFGTKAYKCIPPCSKSDSGSDSSHDQKNH